MALQDRREDGLDRMPTQMSPYFSLSCTSRIFRPRSTGDRGRKPQSPHRSSVRITIIYLGFADMAVSKQDFRAIAVERGPRAVHCARLAAVVADAVPCPLSLAVRCARRLATARDLLLTQIHVTWVVPIFRSKQRHQRSLG